MDPFKQMDDFMRAFSRDNAAFPSLFSTGNRANSPIHFTGRSARIIPIDGPDESHEEQKSKAYSGPTVEELPDHRHYNGTAVAPDDQHEAWLFPHSQPDSIEEPSEDYGEGSSGSSDAGEPEYGAWVGGYVDSCDAGRQSQPDLDDDEQMPRQDEPGPARKGSNERSSNRTGHTRADTK